LSAKRPVAFDPLPDDLSSSVCNLMCRRPIHRPSLVYGARRSPLIYPANRMQSDREPRRMWCYKVCSIDSGLWSGDATTQAATAGAGGGCYLYSSKFVCVKVG